LGQISLPAKPQESSKEESTAIRQDSIMEFVQNQLTDKDLTTIEELGMNSFQLKVLTSI
jgi:hypothetical protein